jgi:hypothetical protein
MPSDAKKEAGIRQWNCDELAHIVLKALKLKRKKFSTYCTANKCL